MLVRSTVFLFFLFAGVATFFNVRTKKKRGLENMQLDLDITNAENILREHFAGSLRRRLLNFHDPKTVIPKGYICAKGTVSWDDEKVMLSELASFMEAYNERNEVFKDVIEQYGVINSNGNGLFHSFAMWVVLRKLRPLVVVESGVRNGFTSWLITKATEDWSPLFIRVDPIEVGWDGLDGNPNAEKHIDFRGDRFQDITEIDWDQHFKEHNLSNAFKERTLFILDDNRDQLKRITEIRKMDFFHVLLDDNYLPGVGTTFSIKDACDGGGELRNAFFSKGNQVQPKNPKRCDNFHQNCEDMDTEYAPWRRYALQLEILVDTYWEAPPLAPLAQPYGSIIHYIEETEKYEGPDLWTEAHSTLLKESTKRPLFDSLEEASKATGLPKKVLSIESGRYIHMAYVKLNHQIKK